MIKFLKKFIPLLKNKYIFSILLFLIWMSFFDKNDFITQLVQRNNLEQMKQDKVFFRTEIDKNRQEIEGLNQNPDKLEKFAREKYLMKRENEDIFVIVEAQE